MFNLTARTLTILGFSAALAAAIVSLGYAIAVFIVGSVE